MMPLTLSHARPLALLGALALSPARPLAQQADTVVRMAGAPKHAGVSTLVEELSIGIVDGAEEYTFGDVTDVAVAKDGSIYVLDRLLFGVRMYDAAGKYLRTIGRRGQGPGEMMSPSGIAVLADGRLALWDMGNWRVNVYSATGANLTQWAFPSSGTSMASRAIVADTAGFVYARKMSITQLPAGQRAPDGSPVRRAQFWLKIRGSDGTIVDTIREPSWPPVVEGLSASNGPSTSRVSMPFSPSSHWEISPAGYLVSGFSDRYAFELHTSDQRVVSVRRSVAAATVASQERDAERKRVEARLRELDPLWSWGSRDIPKTKPFYAAIAIGLDGRVWLMREKSTSPVLGRVNTPMGVGMGGPGGRPPAVASQPGDPVPQRPTPFDVFEPSGAFVGQVQAPPGVSLAVMKGDYIWAIARNEDDVAFVKRYRIVWK